MPFTNAERYKCAERELAMRYRVYERRVDAGQMSRKAADREIALMEDIAADYRARAEADRAAQTLPLELPPAPMLELEPEKWGPVFGRICPKCGAEALDGHITCGRFECDEHGTRRALEARPVLQVVKE